MRWFAAALTVCYLGACGGDSPARPFSVTDAGQAGEAGSTLAAGSGGSAGAAGNAGAGGGHAKVPEGCPLTPPTECSDPKPTYADVAPIFEQRCTSCHDGMHGQWSLKDYEHIADWFGEVKGQLVACTMPPVDAQSEMTVAERMHILMWIRCGYPQ